jgi:hypothetical protein
MRWGRRVGAWEEERGTWGQMFLGEYKHTLDGKGRVSLPRRFRDATGSRVVVSKGFEGSLAV